MNANITCLVCLNTRQVIFLLNCFVIKFFFIPVLSSGDNEAAVTALNETLIPELCGANFLPSADAGEALQPQPPEKIQMIAGESINFYVTINV